MEIAGRQIEIRPATGRRTGGGRWEVVDLPTEGDRWSRFALVIRCGTKAECEGYVKWLMAGSPGTFQQLRNGRWDWTDDQWELSMEVQT